MTDCNPQLDLFDVGWGAQLFQSRFLEDKKNDFETRSVSLLGTLHQGSANIDDIQFAKHLTNRGKLW